MAISTDPSVLAGASRCFDTCIPPGDQRAVQTYLWAQISGVTNPATVLTNARCFSTCVPPAAQLYLQAYLAAVLSGGSLDPSSLANAATCFRSCIPPGGNNAVITYALASRAGGSMDPSTLANAARCFSTCIPPDFQLAAQNYLMAVAAGLSTDPKILLPSISTFLGTLPPGMVPFIVGKGVVAYSGAGGSCAVPTGLTATVNADLSITVSWAATPLGVDFTEIWWSSDNVTFTQIDSISAPANSVILQPSGFTNTYVEARFCTGTPTVLYPLSDAWISRVVANGGATPSNLTRAALHGFEVAISGIKARIYHLNPIAPDSLIAALTPFIVTNGSTLWTKHVAGAPPAESITVAGLKAATDDLNGTIYDTGVSPSAVAAWTATNGGMSVYVGDTAPPSSANNLSGCFDGVSATFGLQANNGAVANGFCWDSTQKTTVGFPVKGGFFSISRTAAALVTAYFANAANAWGSIATNVTNTGRTPPAQNIGVCGEIDSGPAYKPNAARISFVAYHDGFSSTDAESLYVAVNNLRHLLGGGFV